MINVLVMEASSAARDVLAAMLGADPQIRVITALRDGEGALEAVRRLRPHLILMGTHWLGGIAATRQIMEAAPTPIVVVSDHPRDDATSFDAMEAGALAVLHRPHPPGHPEHEAQARELLQTVRLMAEVKVVRRWPRPPGGSPAAQPAEAAATTLPSRVRIVALGASTGGPPVLQIILAALPAAFPAPLVIVQHMAPGFSAGFAEWLAQSCALPVRLAAQGEPLLPGHVYLAPDALQMKVARPGQIVLSHDAPEHGLRPSVSCLFRSVAEVYGADAVAGLLTGMGRDGARELRLLRDRGAFTFAQDKDSSVVHGMPGEAIRLDAARLVLPPEKIAVVLASLAGTGHA